MGVYISSSFILHLSKSMARKLSPDKWLFVIAVALVLFGIVMVNSASAVLSDKYYGPFSHFAVRQFIYSALSLLVMWGMMKIDYRVYNKGWIAAAGLALCFSMLVLVLFQSRTAGVHRWLSMGSFNLQPSEVTKMMIVLFLAYYLSQRDERINDLRRVLIPCLMIVGIFAGLIAIEPDLGTAVTLSLVAAVLLFSAGLSWIYILTSLILSVSSLAFLISRNPYQKERILSFLIGDDPLGTGYQIRQSLIAIGSGGLTGLGLGEGKQKLFFLPQPHTDFIYSLIGEELGLIGTVLVAAGFLLFFWRGIKIAAHLPDKFGYYLAIGFTLMIVVQAFINISVVLKLMPTKGIPLPFISLGGSSILVNLMAVGVLLNLSQHTISSEYG